MERERRKSFYGGLALGYVAGGLIWGLPRLMDNDQNVEDLQNYNKDIETELGNSFGEVDSLILDDGSFTFTTEQGEKLEVSCEGKYSVIEDVAQVTGSIACTEQINITGGNNG